MFNKFNYLNKKVLALTLATSFICSPFIGINVFAEYKKYPDKCVFALKEDLSSSWGTPRFDEQNRILPGENCSNQKISFGKNPITGKPMLWWIAARTLRDGNISKTQSSSSHMLLCAKDSISGKNFKEDPEIEKSSKRRSPTCEKEEFKYLKYLEAANNHYGKSVCRKTLKNVAARIFEKDQKQLINEVPISTFDYMNSQEYQTKDKLYLPSANSKFGVVSFSKKDISQSDLIENIDPAFCIPFTYVLEGSSIQDKIFWSRSADAKQNNCTLVYTPSNENKVSSSLIKYDYEMMPIADMTIESLIFAAASAKNEFDGVFCKVEKDDKDYGMEPRFSANGTDLTDALLDIDSIHPEKIRYENIPQNAKLGVCVCEAGCPVESFVATVTLNRDGLNGEGAFDLDKIDSSILGKDKNLMAQVWIEYETEDGLKVATRPQSTSFTTKESISIRNIPSLTYDGRAKEHDTFNVSFAGKQLNKGKDFITYYSNNINSGTAYLTICGVGMYQYYITTKSFLINPLKPTITLKDKGCSFDGERKLIDPATIVGITEEELPKIKVVYTYSQEESFAKKLISYTLPNAKFKVPAKAPKEIGVYYVKAEIESQGNYLAGVSNIAKLEITE